jgi:phage shock protein E
VRIAIIATVAIIGLLGTTFVNNQSNQGALKPQQAAAKQAYAQIIDVRTPEEYATSHAESAILLPIQDIERGKLPQGKKSDPIALYCRSGNRSSQAKIMLEKQGYTNVTDLGGLSDLKKHGLSLVE